MKRTAISLAAALLAVSVQAATIKGRVYNPTYSEGEPFATVRVFSAKGDKPVATVLTDVDGNFEVQTKAGGSYRLEFSSVAKEPVQRNVTVSRDEVFDFGDIEMKEDAQHLDEVVVVAQRPLVQMSADQMTYNVADDTDSRTFTLLDMLRKVPMVTVDGEDNITVNGSSNFQVYVDGKPSLLFSGNPSQIFKSMPASAVQKVEVVTSPGARYDAEGVGGVLNLVMNKAVAGDMADTKAYNVSLGVRANNRGFGGNAYASAQAGRLSASLNMIHNDSRPGSTEVETIREQGNMTTLSTATSKPHVPFTMGNLSLEYTLDSLTTLGASFALNRFSTDARGVATTTMNQDGNSIYSYLNDSRTDGMRQGLNGSVNLSRSFGAGRRNQLQITYQIAHENNNNLNDNTFEVLIPGGTVMPGRLSDTRQKTTEQIVLADFSSRFSDSHTLSAGLKGTFRNATADNSYFIDNVYDADGSLNYENDSRIAAAYGEYAYRGARFNAKAGLRYEHTFQSISYKLGSIDDYSDNYGNLVPSASLGYNLGMTSNIGLNYNMRISRPGISYLNPYVNRADPTVISYGNPDLDVEKTHNVSAVYNLFTPKFMLNATLSHAYTGNGIEQYSFMADGVMNTTYGNIVKRNTTSLSVFMNWMIGIRTRIFLNGGASYLDIRSAQLDASNSGLQGNLMLGVQQTLPWDIRANAFLIASTKNRNLQGWTTGFQMLSVNFSKSFLSDRLGVSLGVNTGLSKGGRMEIGTHIDTPAFSNHTAIRVPITSVTLGVTFRFGSSVKVKEISSKLIDNDYIDTRSQMESISNTESSVGAQ
ncbi:MAG: TonB-dependent receptor family protein [Muribaculaceae bacterium]|nr:TonB-dependent receptor family protein [Muribaculaceae bacterium]